MATARRIPFNTMVIPTITREQEEEYKTQEEFMASPGGTLGGSGNVAVHATQSSAGWTSMIAGTANFWEQHTTVNWEEGGAWTFDGTVTASSTPDQLSSDSGACGFAFIKNEGLDNDCFVSLNGLSGPYYISVPPGGAVLLRGDGNLNCDDIYVQTELVSTTDVEYVIAKAA